MQSWRAGVRTLAAVLAAVAPESMHAFKCAGRNSVCFAFQTADVVFAGRAESIDPNIDSGDPATRRQIEQLFPDANLSAKDLDRSPENFSKLKTYYSGVFAGERRNRIARSATFEDLNKAIEEAVDEGGKVRFTVLTRYKGLPEGVRNIDVWTDFSACGAYFLKGETYLVYAHQADSGRTETGACSRTIRLTDAGPDLAYLHFMQTVGQAVARVFGFVTNNELDLRTPRYFPSVSSPVPHLVVELRSSAKTLLAAADKDGEFAFDGLAPGDYTLSVFDGYLDRSKPLTEPRRVRVSTQKCLEQIVYVPKRSTE